MEIQPQCALRLTSLVEYRWTINEVKKQFKKSFGIQKLCREW